MASEQLDAFHHHILRGPLVQARQLLGVGVGATEAEVKQAFRVAAMQWHPDISTLPDAKERFQEAQSALEMLLASDPAAQSIGSASSGASSQTMGSKANAGWPSWYSWDLDEKFRRGWVPGQEPWAMEDADSLGIKRGSLLVASETLEAAALTKIVALILEVRNNSIEAVILNSETNSGGSLFEDEVTVLHTCFELAEAPLCPVASDYGLFAEHRLSIRQAELFTSRLDQLDHQHATLRGHTSWGIWELPAEVGRGDWTVHTWGASTAAWWLRDRTSFSKEDLWWRAKTRLKSAG
eukprot:TRINITY_DN28560_c0_g1_i1.p1 TRINITY_DN28560_c0_g1~~TRINITY_DN28560_c0_g1_i1.p1  ORF type:complete len:295 (-),score=48.39 TRINITY_DN28560_c0_g1_i1:54-938(-)